MTDQLHLRHGPCLRSSQTDARLNLQSPDKSSTHILDILEQCIWHPSTKMLPSLDRKPTNCHFPVPYIFGSKLPVPGKPKYQVTRLHPWFLKLLGNWKMRVPLKLNKLKKQNLGSLGFLLFFFKSAHLY